MKAKVQIVDDDAKLNRLLGKMLSDFGLKVVESAGPEAGLKALEEKAAKVILLQVALPGFSGSELARMLRESNTVPVLLLTAEGEAKDPIAGPEAKEGAHPKAFELRELVVRIESAFRKVEGIKKSRVERFGRLEIDFSKHIVRLDRALLDLSPNEYAALALLVRNRGEVLNRDQILAELKGIEWDAINRSVDLTISRLRHKLKDDPKNPAFIKTVWGIGYLFIWNKRGQTQ